MQDAENISSKPKPTIFPFAVMVGMVSFMIADGSPGGLSGGTAYIIGIIAVIILYLAIGLTIAYLEQNIKATSPALSIFTPQGNRFIAGILKWQNQKANEKRSIALLKRSKNLRNLLEIKLDKYRHLIERLWRKEQLLQAKNISVDDFEMTLNEVIEAYRKARYR